MAGECDGRRNTTSKSAGTAVGLLLGGDGQVVRSHVIYYMHPVVPLRCLGINPSQQRRRLQSSKNLDWYKTKPFGTVPGW